MTEPKWERDDLAENIRLFGRSKYVDRLRKRMTNYVQRGETKPRETRDNSPRNRPPEPHQWPCGDPYCQPCDDAVKRLLRDVGVLPRKGGTR
jgi:hypothetical protein